MDRMPYTCSVLQYASKFQLEQRTLLRFVICHHTGVTAGSVMITSHPCPRLRGLFREASVLAP